jgi:hypothetical protein
VTRADHPSSPETLIVVGVLLIFAGIAIAKWWRAVIRFFRRTSFGSGRMVERFYGPEDSPEGLSLAVIFFAVVFLPVGGVIFIVTGINRL